jgi:penicillin-insensitive murein endopeptidase
MIDTQPKDSRGYFMLPQAPEDAGYYVYGKINGKPSQGAFQYAPPSMLTAILQVEREWQAVDTRRFGIGDISLAGGLANRDHKSHKSGLEVDVRPLRKDGLHLPVTWSQAEYDHDATAKLIELFHTYAPISLVYFNGPGIPFVTKMIKHDDHFHVKLRG